MTQRVIPMGRAKGILAQLRAAEAKYRQAKFLLVDLAARVEYLSPNDPVLDQWRAFLTPPADEQDTPNDSDSESR